MLMAHMEEASMKAEFSKYIRDIKDGILPIEDATLFIVRLQAIGRLNLPPINDNTFEDLKSSGNLNLIDDYLVSEAIRNYYNDIPYWWFDQYSKQLVEGYLPLALDAIPLKIHEEIIQKEIVAGTQAIYFGGKINNVNQADIASILDYIRNNYDFNFNLKRIARSHLIHVKLLNGLKNDVPIKEL